MCATFHQNRLQTVASRPELTETSDERTNSLSLRMEPSLAQSIILFPLFKCRICGDLALNFQMDFVMTVVPEIRQPQLYDLCGSTLSLIFDLSVPYASKVIEPLLNVSAIGNQCPPLKALKSKIERGFDCNVGEVLNMDTNDVPRCCKFNINSKKLYFNTFKALSELSPIGQFASVT